MKKLILMALLLLVSCGSPSMFMGTATLYWTAPIENTDGSELTDLAGFRVYYGLQENELLNTRLVDSDQEAVVFINLASGNTYYFAVTAFNELGIESEYSEIVSKMIL